MPSMNQPKFMKQYVYALSSDFKSADGTPASWAKNQPSHWGSESRSIKFDSAPSTHVLSGDDTLLAIGVDKEIHIYDVATLELRQVLRGHPHVVNGLVFAPKSRTGHSLVSQSQAISGGQDGIVVLWELDDEGKDTNPAKPVDVDGISMKCLGYALEQLGWPKESENSQLLGVDFEKALSAAAARKTLENRTVISGSFGSFGSETFSKDGRYMLTKRKNDSTQHGEIGFEKLPLVEVWDTATNTSLHELRGHTDAIMWMEASPDSKKMASISWDGSVRIWDLKSGECLHRFGDFGGQMWAGAWSPDSKYLAFSQGSPKTFVFVYNIETGEQLSKFEGIKHWARSIDWSRDGKYLASGASSGLICVWDPFTGKGKMKWELKFDDKDHMMQNFISTGNVKFVGTKLVFKTTEGTVEVYDFESNLKMQFTRGPQDKVNSMVYDSMSVSHDGKFVISRDADNIVRFWNL
jgi:WD40 repeat protein